MEQTLNPQNSWHAYVQNRFIFLLLPASLKNIEYFDLENILNKTLLKKQFSESLKIIKGRTVLHVLIFQSLKVL